MRRPVAALAVLLLPVLTLLGPSSASGSPTGSASATPDDERAGLRYVALGDSYSSGAGLEPADPDAPEACDRSSRNYPKLVAKRIGADLTDVSCSGAQTSDYTETQEGADGPQLDALGPRTRLVTQTIGGNDGGLFSNAVTQCAALSFSDPDGKPCKEQYGSQFLDTVRNTIFPNVRRALRQVHQAAPRAEVAILGYPTILPPTTGCPSAIPLATGDVPYLYRLQTVLNTIVRRAARETRSTFVDLSRASAKHDACRPVGTRWVEPAFGELTAARLHPNALGMRNLATQVIEQLRLR